MGESRAQDVGPGKHTAGTSRIILATSNVPPLGPTAFYRPALVWQHFEIKIEIISGLRRKHWKTGPRKQHEWRLGQREEKIEKMRSNKGRDA